MCVDPCICPPTWSWSRTSTIARFGWLEERRMDDNRSRDMRGSVATVSIDIFYREGFEGTLELSKQVVEYATYN